MKEARTVGVCLNIPDGKFDEIEDTLNNNPLRWKLDLPFEEHFGWDLSKYSEPDTKLDVETLLKSNKIVAGKASPKSAGETVYNTVVASPQHAFIMLDVGFWGQFKKTQRDFGMIENGHVWLCSFDGQKSNKSSISALQSNGCIKAANLAAILDSKVANLSLGIHLVQHAQVANTGLFKEGLKDLYIVFPDMHLPEKWPDYPRPEDRYHIQENTSREEDELHCEELRKRLVWCQHDPMRDMRWEDSPFALFPGFKEELEKRMGKKDLEKYLKEHRSDICQPLSDAEMEEIQKYIDRLEAHPELINNNDVKYSFKLHSHKNVIVSFTPRQFLAEKAIIDRQMMSDSGWFYNASKNNDYLGDPQPAIDLANLLCAIRTLQKDKSQKGKVFVVQVGDLLELWMNREFLYRECDIAKKDVITGGKPELIRKVGSGWYDENFQIRSDKGWQKGRARHYYFDPWDKGEEHRYSIKNDGKPSGEKLTRLKSSLRERLDNIHNFSLVIPEKAHPSLGRLEASLKSIGKDFDSYVRTDCYNPVGWCANFLNSWDKNEAYWNRLIVDLFNEVEFLPLHGNHDGYRADPILTSGIGCDNYLCDQGWISKPGIWFEHCHRWDQFNRDGMAFGAAVTNYVYYFPRLIDATISNLQNVFAPQRQESFMPGAALWFALVNHKNKHKNIIKDEKGKTMELPTSGDNAVYPFGVYVIGHTHDPDIAYMTFREDDITAIKKRAKNLEEYLKIKGEQALKESEKVIKKAVENAIKSVKDAESSVEEFVDEVTSWPYKAIYEAERAIKHLYGLDQFY